MCWNAEVSLNSFLFGMFAILVGIVFKMSFSVILFCLTIVCMQFIEYIVWSNYDDSDVNTAASIAAAGLLWLQPIASIVTFMNPTLRTMFLALYFGFTLIGAAYFDKTKYTMKRAPNGHLEWQWIKKDYSTLLTLAIYFFFLFTPLLLGKNHELLILAIATLALSLYSFWKDNTWGSMWCWIVNILVLLIVGKTVIEKTT